LIAGGGTGGHIIPALAIGRALVARGHPASSLWFVGSDRELDRRLIPAAGFRLITLPGRGIVRGWTWRNVEAVAGLVRAAARALTLVHRTRPKVVIAVGGYASFACALAAVLWRIPLVVAEQNAAPGLVNKLVGRFAAASAVSFAGTPLPRAVVTGNPVRPEITAIDRSEPARQSARRELGLPRDGRVVAAAGGSLGARRINEAVAQLAGLWRDRPDVAIRHVVGERDRADYAQRTSALDGGKLVYQQVAFEDRMDLLLTAADVAVQRAGASTVSELTVAGLPSVLVPLPGAPGDHQTVNARRLAGAGAAVVVADAELDGARLAEELDRLLGDDELLSRMGAAARQLGHPNAADAVAALAEEHARA
jgi:undecaprenyldiphospho-muramoylpentapeptide beta-N-acetylglucosaminyltransferase